MAYNPQRLQMTQQISGEEFLGMKISYSQISYGLIVLLWIAGVAGYIIYLRRELRRRNREEQKEDEQRKRHRGKKCPQCQNVIGAKRIVCQHCGYRFPESDPHAQVEINREPIPIKQEKSEAGGHEHGHSSHSSHGHHSRRKRGKKCPECGNIINYYREVCQHCGYKFDMNKASPSGDNGEAAT
jgi:uncharacterized OB-fold protein